MTIARLAIPLALAACRGGSGGGGDSAPPPFLPPPEVEAPGSEATSDLLPWNPAFLAHHDLTAVTVVTRMAGSDVVIEESLRFDGDGRLVARQMKSGSDQAGSWTFEWRGERLAQVTESLRGGATSRITYRYDDEGRPVEIAHPDTMDGLTEMREYDAAGRLTTRRWIRIGAPGDEERIERDAGGRMVAAIRTSPEGDRQEERRTYQGDRLTGMTSEVGTVKKVWRLAYDAAGRIQRIDVDVDGKLFASDVFEYDERGFPRAVRRTSSVSDVPATTVEYRFDQPRETP